MNASPLIIVGNGIAGTTLAREIRKKSTRPILLISEEHPYFFSRTALMYVYMGHLTFEHTQPYASDFWKQNNISLLQDRVTGFDAQKKKFFSPKEIYSPMKIWFGLWVPVPTVSAGPENKQGVCKAFTTNKISIN